MSELRDGYYWVRWQDATEHVNNEPQIMEYCSIGNCWQYGDMICEAGEVVVLSERLEPPK